MKEEDIKWRYDLNFPWEVIKLSFFNACALSFVFVVMTMIAYDFKSIQYILLAQFFFFLIYVFVGFFAFLVINLTLTKLLKKFLLVNKTKVNLNLMLVITSVSCYLYFIGFKFMFPNKELYDWVSSFVLSGVNLLLYINFYVNLFKSKEILDEYELDLNLYLEKTIYFEKK